MAKAVSMGWPALLLLAGCAALQHPGGERARAADPRAFTAMAAEARAKERAMAELALRRAESPDLRAYAGHLLADADRDDPALRRLAQQNGVAFPASLSGQGIADLETLDSLPRGRFDAVYADISAGDERDALTLYTLAGQGAPAEVARYAVAEQPVLRRHFADAYRLYNEVRTDFYAQAYR